MRTAMLTALAALLFPGAAEAFECTLSAPHCVVSARFADQVVPYVVRRPPPGSPITQTQLVQAIGNAFETWSRPTCTSLRFELHGVLDADEPSSVKNEIRVVHERWGGNRNALATTRLAFDSTRGSIKSSTISINAEHHVFGDVETMNGCSGITDLEAALVHEVGHFIGIAHPCEVDEGTCVGEAKCPRSTCVDLGMDPEIPDQPTMWADLRPCQSHFRTLTTDDQDAVCSIYPRAGPVLACAFIPETDGELVENAAFGCTAHANEHARRGSHHALFVVLLLIVGANRRRG